MVTGILLALAAGLCFAIGAGLFARVAQRQLPFMGFLCIGGSIGLLLSLFCVVNWDAIPQATRTAEVCLWIGLGAMANVAGHRAMAGAMAGGRAPVAWAIGQASQAIPFLASIAIWSERSGIIPWAGVAAVLAGVAILSQTKPRAHLATLSSGGMGLAVLALLCYGANNTLMAVPSHWPGWQDTIHLRLPLTLAMFALGGAIFSIGHDRQTLRSLAPMAIPYGILLVVCFGCVYLALDHLGRAGAAGLFWPIACSTGVAVYAAWEHLILRKRMTLLEIAGIATIIIGIVALAAPRIAS